MLNSDRFLDAFYTIEKTVRRISGADAGDGFTGSVHRAARSDERVRRFREVLVEYAQLRNAIVHGPRGENVLAEPNDAVVAEIERIARLLVQAPQAAEFMSRKVTIMQEDQPVARAIEAFRTGGFSQLPIYRGQQFVGLLTTTALVYWLSGRVQSGRIDLGSAEIAEILRSNPREEKRYIFMPAKTTAFQILAAFERQQRTGQRLRTVLVTKSGQPNEPLLGIITTYDLPAVYAAVDGAVDNHK